MDDSDQLAEVMVRLRYWCGEQAQIQSGEAGGLSVTCYRQSEVVELEFDNLAELSEELDIKAECAGYDAFRDGSHRSGCPLPESLPRDRACWQRGVDSAETRLGPR